MATRDGTVKKYPKILSKKQMLFMLALLAGLFMAIVLLGSFYFSRLEKIFYREAEKQLDSENSNISWAVEKSFSKNICQLESIATFLGGAADFFSSEVMDALISQSQIYGWKQMGIALPDGTYHAHTGKTGTVKDRDYFQAAIQGVAAINYIPCSDVSQSPAVILAVPVYDSSRETAAVLIAEHNEDSIRHMLELAVLSEYGVSYIVDSAGEIIWCRVTDMNWPLRGETDIYQIVKHVRMPEPDSAAFVRKILQSHEKGLCRIEQPQRSLYFMYAPLDFADWYLFSVVPVNAVHDGGHAMLRFTLYFVVAAVVLFFFFFVMVFILLRRNQKMLYDLAYTDDVIGAPNLNYLNALVQPLVAASAERSYAYIILDVEKFKLLNERFGYDTGDKMLRHIYRSIRSVLRPGEYAARIVFDDFCMLLKFDSGHNIKKRLYDLTSRINTFPKELGETYFVTVAYGVYIIENEIRDLKKCYDFAEIALEMATQKTQSGVTKIGFYHEYDHQRLKNDKALENKMESALVRGQFEVFLQPKFDIETNCIAGAEALVRWRDPEKGLIPPDSFIPLFERNGMIAKLDLFVFEEVCRLLRKWLDAGLVPVPVSVNLSRVYIADDGFFLNYERIRKKYGIPVSYLEFELTETVVFNNSLLLRTLIEKLHEYGYRISLDDFGSGFSSLNVLKDLPVDTIKLDRIFFLSLSGEENTAMTGIIECIIDLSRKLNLDIISEGVETQTQVDFLRRAGCRFVQGFVYSKPQTSPDFESMLFGAAIA